MKKITKLFAALSLALGTLLTGCNKSAPAPSLTGIAVDASGAKVEFIVDDEFSSEGIIVTASYSDESSKVVSTFTVSSPDMSSAGTKEVTVSYTESDVTKTASYNITVKVIYDAAKVAEDTNAALAEYGLALEFDERYQEYGTAVSFGASEDESEENLSTAAYTLASFLPSYMEEDFEIYGDPTSEDYYDLFGDGSIYFYMSFTSPDELCGVAVVSYIYNGLLVAQMSVADLAA